jgi:hypothetical protein
MPKYKITYGKKKLKVIRASTTDIALERASKSESNGWVVERIEELPKE